MSAPNITRLLRARQQGYVGGHAQQGRALLECDANEAAQARADDFTTAIRDVAGVRGSANDGFMPDLVSGQTVMPKLVKFGAVLQAYVLDYPLKSGSMLLAGMRTEQAAPESAVFQREFLQIGPAAAPLAQIGTQRQLSILRAWEQPVSAIEDAELLEPALHGADGALRLRRMHRVETRTVEADTCDEAFDEVLTTLGVGDTTSYDPASGELRSNARMQLTFGSEPPGDCPGCDPLLRGRYLGQEDHAIRIMLASQDSYVWALDNAAPLYRAKLIFDGNGARVKMLTPPKDSYTEPELNRVVEILPWSALLKNGTPSGGKGFDQPLSNENVAARAGALGTVDTPYVAADRSFHVQLDAATLQSLGLAEPKKGGKDPDKQATVTLKTGALPEGDVFALEWDSAHPQSGELNPSDTGEQTGYVYLRFWHLKRPDEAAAVPLNAGLPLGRTGVVPVFNGKGRRGDVWQASLRVADPDTIWPWDIMQTGGQPPDGPHEALAPLALVEWASLFGGLHEVISVQDCRSNLPAITNRGCCTHVVGHGTSTRYQSVQDAIDALPASGGRICIRDGTFDGAFRLAGRENVIIEGCGPRTILTDDGSLTEALAGLESTSTGRILLRNLTLRTAGQIAARLSGPNITLEQLIVETGPGEQLTTQSAVRGLDVNACTIRNCTFNVATGTSPHAALYLRSTGDVLVENNRIDHAGAGAERSWGGIHLLGNGTGIDIRSNQINNALGHGITLGSVSWRAIDGSDLGHVGAGFGQALEDGSPTPTGRLSPTSFGGQLFYPEPDLPLTDLLIADNEIAGCTGSGIGAVALDVVHDEVARAAPLCMRRTRFSIEGQIRGNQLSGNGAGSGSGAVDRTRGGVVLSDAQNLKITQNEIQGSARAGQSGPRTGIFVGFGTDLSITGNRISLETTDPDPAPDISGGIVLGLDQSSPVLERILTEAPLTEIRVEDNKILCQHAPALAIHAGGACAVSGNALETLSGVMNGDLFGTLTLGIVHPTRVAEAVDLPTGEPDPERWQQPEGSAAFLAGRAQAIAATGGLVVCDNQISTRTAEGAARRQFLPVAIYSLGSVSLTDNQLSAIVPDGTLAAHALVIGATTLVSDNQIAEPVEAGTTSLIVEAPLLTLGTGNQLTHCPVIFGGTNNGNDLYFAAEDNLTWLRLQAQRCEQLATEFHPELAALLAAVFGTGPSPTPNLSRAARRDSDFRSIFRRRNP